MSLVQLTKHCYRCLLRDPCFHSRVTPWKHSGQVIFFVRPSSSFLVHLDVRSLWGHAMIWLFLHSRLLSFLSTHPMSVIWASFSFLATQVSFSLQHQCLCWPSTWNSLPLPFAWHIASLASSLSLRCPDHPCKWGPPLSSATRDFSFSL
jgi:hypothetical protein